MNIVESTPLSLVKNKVPVEIEEVVGKQNINCEHEHVQIFLNRILILIYLQYFIRTLGFLSYHVHLHV